MFWPGGKRVRCVIGIGRKVWWKQGAAQVPRLPPPASKVFTPCMGAHMVLVQISGIRSEQGSDRFGAARTGDFRSGGPMHK